jgi:hypothetical protein
MAKSGNRKPGGGIGSNVNREVGVRVGRGAQEQRPRGVSQIGESIGNKSTETGKVKGIPSERIQGKYLPAGLSVPLGNEVAKNVGAGGVGTGRKLYGQSGSQQVYGTPVTGLPRITNTKNQWPDTNTKPR